jgi:FAD dependent monooxygenase
VLIDQPLTILELLVIGADGVHSHVRQLMWDYAAQKEPGTIPESDKSAMFTQYRGMFGVSDKIPADLGNADVNICYGHGVTKLIFTQPGMVYWAVCFKDEFSQPPKRYRPGTAEQDEVAHRFKDIQMTGKSTFADFWDNKTRGGILNIEEGILDKWYAGRIVLVGDSAHKVRLTATATPLALYHLS